MTPPAFPTPPSRPRSIFEVLISDYQVEMRDLINLHGVDAIFETLQLVSRVEYYRQ